MVDVSSYNELFSYLNKIKTETLENEVADMTKEKMQEHVKDDVYSTYKPKTYKRTGDLFSEVVSEMIDDDTLEVKDIAHEDERDVVRVVETGQGYWSAGLDAKIGPRPFVENTRKEIEQDHLVAETLKAAFKEKGITTE